MIRIAAPPSRCDRAHAAPTWSPAVEKSANLDAGCAGKQGARPRAKTSSGADADARQAESHAAAQALQMKTPRPLLVARASKALTSSEISGRGLFGTGRSAISPRRCVCAAAKLDGRSTAKARCGRTVSSGMRDKRRRLSHEMPRPELGTALAARARSLSVACAQHSTSPRARHTAPSMQGTGCLLPRLPSPLLHLKCICAPHGTRANGLRSGSVAARASLTSVRPAGRMMPGCTPRHSTVRNPLEHERGDTRSHPWCCSVGTGCRRSGHLAHARLLHCTAVANSRCAPAYAPHTRQKCEPRRSAKRRHRSGLSTAR
jgi:hypothetical protein